MFDFEEKLDSVKQEMLVHKQILEDHGESLLQLSETKRSNNIWVTFDFYLQFVYLCESIEH